VLIATGRDPFRAGRIDPTWIGIAGRKRERAGVFAADQPKDAGVVATSDRLTGLARKGERWRALKEPVGGSERNLDRQHQGRDDGDEDTHRRDGQTDCTASLDVAGVAGGAAHSQTDAIPPGPRSELARSASGTQRRPDAGCLNVGRK
jgi:hypothetical protein